MVRVTIYKDRDGTFRGFRSIGHAGYAKAGEDIVCAGVSALVLNAVNSIEAFAGDDFELESDEASGLVSLRFSKAPSREAELLMKSLVLGLEGILDAYGDAYVSLVTKEV